MFWGMDMVCGDGMCEFFKDSGILRGFQTISCLIICK